MAEALFDRAAFDARLATRRLGRTLLVRAETGSTNDDAFDAYGEGAPEGTVVVAESQTRGRGRAGRRWHQVPGRGLSLSLLLVRGCDPRAPGALPLAAGLALARALERLGVEARLEWPNDLLLGERKLAGILAESRASADGEPLVVVGVGVNVSHRPADFPPEIAPLATSLAIAGHAVAREAVAAEFLNAFEPLWTELEEGGSAGVLAAWSARASFWGHPVTVRAPGGDLTGLARGLDPAGGLVLRLESGAETTVLAGDLEVAWPAERPTA